MVTGIFATMVDDYKKRLAAAMKQAGVSPDALAKHLEMTPQGVKKALDGKTAELSASNNAKAAKFLGVTSDWLVLGSEAGMQLQLSDDERAMVLAYRSVQPPKRLMNDIPRDDPPRSPRFVNPSRKAASAARKEKKR